MALLRLEHRILEEMRRRSLCDQNILIAVSGGLDSVALTSILSEIAKVLSIKVFIAHVHHGWIYGEQGAYRLKAWKFCQKLAKKLQLNFYSNLLEAKPELRFLEEPERPLRSEEDLRIFRYRILEKLRCQVEEGYGRKTLLATAHTANDQLETRLINLIRGTGQLGAHAMQFRKDTHLRPLLTSERAELKFYLQEKNLEYLHDPSNDSVDPFRNWIRNEWLVQLESKRPGSIDSLSRSLRLLAEASESTDFEIEKCFLDDCISMRFFLELSFENKKRVLARFMRHKNMKNYGNNHVLEVIKRLDSNEKEYNFTLLKHIWTIDTEFIKASPV